MSSEVETSLEYRLKYAKRGSEILRFAQNDSKKNVV